MNISQRGTSWHFTALLKHTRAGLFGAPLAQCEGRSGHRNNIEELLPLAEYHGVTSLAYAGLADPEVSAPAWKSIVHSQACVALRRVKELLAVLDALQSAGIPAISLKGPVLSAVVYGDLTRRRFRDLDVLVPRASVTDACDILLSHGYRIDSKLHWTCASARLRSRDRQLLLYSPESEVKVDLHWKVLPAYVGSRLHDEDLLARVTESLIAGRTVASLRPEEMLLYLSAHGMKHAWTRLIWVCDVAGIARDPTLSLQSFFARAERTRLLRACYVALRLASELLGSPDPLPYVDASTAAAGDPIVAKLMNAFFSGAVEGPTAFQQAALSARMLDSAQDRVRYWWQVGLVPSEAEWSRIQLPPLLYALYVPHRLLRLVSKLPFLAWQLSS